MQHGILPLWKEKGMTSHDCVFKLRKLLKTKKVGHTGTLDPNVEGVLPICVGRATKVAEYLTDAGKTYEAVVTIGYSTTTEDADGEMVESDTTPKTISRKRIEEVLKQLTGDIVQIPPMYSAVKVNGRKLYEYARMGIEIERPSRTVTIYELSLLDVEEQFSGETISFGIRISCSKGTYIRTLAVQIGEALGYPAHMSALVRTSSGSFFQKDCITLSEAAIDSENDVLYDRLLPLEYALTHFPSVELNDELMGKVMNGQVLPIHEMLKKHDLIVFTTNHKAIAIYRKHPTKLGLMKPEKMLFVNGKEE